MVWHIYFSILFSYVATGKKRIDHVFLTNINWSSALINQTSPRHKHIFKVKSYVHLYVYVNFKDIFILDLFMVMVFELISFIWLHIHCPLNVAFCNNFQTIKHEAPKDVLIIVFSLFPFCCVFFSSFVYFYLALSLASFFYSTIKLKITHIKYIFW